MQTNFHFLHEWPEIASECLKAEKNVYTEPRYAAILSRSALEKMVHWMYENDGGLELPYDTSLSALIHDYSFKAIINEKVFKEINIIRKIGNDGAHGKRIGATSSLLTIKYLHSFAAFLAKFYGSEKYTIELFNETYLEQIREQEQEESKQLKGEIEILKAQLAEQASEFREQQKALEQRIKFSEEEKEKYKGTQRVLTQRRTDRQKSVDFNKAIPQNVPEEITRKFYIDVLLREAGWDQLRPGRELEYAVSGMPLSTNPSGKGAVDYVLWGADGLPLAVIEAKRTMVAAEKGRHQATLYADCLEKEFGRRPIIFYSNGFETYLWDDTFYIPRQVQGFYTKDELQLLIDRRIIRSDLRKYQINTEIAGRPYQIEAIKRVGERFVAEKHGKLVGRHRRALLVMATGSGKTRTAASIIDMMTKSNWAKRILFLADRNALVTQAKNAISTQLQNLTCIDLTKEKENTETRMVFSTYPTLLNKIDAVKTDDERFYGVGHFDLIIIDEAHRSVYQKYKAIFDYFDAMVIGLTATPKTDVDHNTYELFDIEDNNPTFAYELNDAVKDGYLVPPKAASVPIKFLREGIKYKELTPDEQKQYEEKFGDPTELSAPEEIGSEAFNRWLFNTDTTDKVLHHLMNNGLKIEGGDKLGKTIIFAKNHEHAKFIEERFNNNYPEYGGHFLRVIDNYEPKAQDLLDRFTNDLEEEDPQIAVSVDMMDTGVDAPRVLNLVFFKIVKSSSKFWQMIGRGTRLRLNLFGPGEDKKEFLIFDFCENFEFFDEFPQGIVGRAQKPISQQIFEAKLEVAELIREAAIKTEEDIALAERYMDGLHASIASLDQRRFVVRMELRKVKEYTERERWRNLSKGDVIDICAHLSKLPPPEGNDERARRFDLLMLMIQLCMLKETNDTKYITRVAEMAKALSRRGNIPVIAHQMPLIEKLQQDDFWNRRTLTRMEDVRTAIRYLVKYLEYEAQAKVYTSFQDNLDLESISVRDVVQQYRTLQSYKDRVEKYLRENKDHLVISKITHNQPITAAELNQLESILFDDEQLGTRAEYVETYGEQPLGVFIRSILGLDIEAANALFTDFLVAGNLKADQLTFINNVIKYLTVNGRIEKKLLFDNPPFNNEHQNGIIGLFDDAEATRILKLIDSVNGNAEVG